MNKKANKTQAGTNIEEVSKQMPNQLEDKEL